MRRKKTRRSSKFGKAPHAHPPPVPGSRHLQLLNSDHLEELSLCPPLPQEPHKIQQLCGNGYGNEGVFLHLPWISSQQGSQLIQVSHVFPQDLGEERPQLPRLLVPAFLLPSEVSTFVHHATLPGHRSSVPALA